MPGNPPPPKRGLKPEPDLDLAVPAEPKDAGSTLDHFGAGFDEEHFGAPAAAPPAKAAAAHPAFGDVGFDFGGADEGGAKLELDSYQPDQPAPLPAHPRAPTAEPAIADSAPIRAGAVALLAGYGAAPKGVHLAPFYTWRVFTRQRALLLALRGLNTQIENTEHSRDQLLADVATSLRPALEADARFEQHLGGVRQIEGLATERGALLNETSAAHRAQMNELDAELKKQEAEIAKLRESERSFSDDMARKRQAHDRVLAKQKRLLIEARGLHDIAGDPNKIAALQDEAGALQAEIDQKRTDLESANFEVLRVQSEISDANERIRQVQARHRALDAQFGKQIGARSAGYQEAERRLIHALADLGKQALASAHASSVEPGILDEIGRVDAEAKRLNELREQHVQALDAYDRQTHQRGILIVALVAVILVLVIVVLLLR